MSGEATPTTPPPEELKPPKKMTLKWLVDHMPIDWYWKGGVAIISFTSVIFGFGYKLGSGEIPPTPIPKNAGIEKYKSIIGNVTPFADSQYYSYENLTLMLTGDGFITGSTIGENNIEDDGSLSQKGYHVRGCQNTNYYAMSYISDTTNPQGVGGWIAKKDMSNLVGYVYLNEYNSGKADKMWECPFASKMGEKILLKEAFELWSKWGISKNCRELF